MTRKLLMAGAIFGLTAVIFGAFAAHGLKENISPESLTSFETGVRFQMYHALLLLILGGLEFISIRISAWIFYLLCSGIILFSGSIYLLSTGVLFEIDFRSIALTTPVGGSLLIIAWGMLLLKFIKLKNK